MTRPAPASAFTNARPVSGLSPLDLADHAAFVREHNARKAAIYDAPLDQRAAMTRTLERNTAAFSRGDPSLRAGTLGLAPVTPDALGWGA